MDQRDTTLAKIGTRHLHLETLQARNSDSLDFHDMAVWSIKAALEAAWEAGRQSREPVLSGFSRETEMRLPFDQLPEFRSLG